MLHVLERLIDCVTVLQSDTPKAGRDIGWCAEFVSRMLDVKDAHQTCRRMEESDCKTDWELKWLFMPSRKSQGYILTHTTTTGRQCTLYFGIADNRDYMLPKEQNNEKSSIKPRIFVYTDEFRNNPIDVSQYSWIYSRFLHDNMRRFLFGLLNRYIQFAVLSHWLLDFLYDNDWHVGSVNWIDKDGNKSTRKDANKYIVTNVDYSPHYYEKCESVNLRYKITGKGNDHVVVFKIYYHGVESDIRPDNMAGLMTLLQNGEEYDDGLDWS
jgi:hypothetical protein